MYHNADTDLYRNVHKTIPDVWKFDSEQETEILNHVKNVQCWKKNICF